MVGATKISGTAVEDPAGRFPNARCRLPDGPSATADRCPDDDIGGVNFEDAWAGRIIVEIDGLPVPVIGLKQLLANKLASGREKDLLDAKIIRDRLA